MIILDVEQNSEEWLSARRCKITGSKLKDIVTKRGSGKKIGYYQLIADRLSIEPDNEDARDRGHRLEQEAIDCFESETNKEVDRSVGMAISDLHKDISISPDGLVKKGAVFVEGVEVKALGDARHVEAFLTDEIPQDYIEQIMQYFIVIETLEKVSLVLYTDRIPSMKCKIIEVLRKDHLELIKYLTDYQVDTLQEIDTIVERWAF